MQSWPIEGMFAHSAKYIARREIPHLFGWHQIELGLEQSKYQMKLKNDQTRKSRKFKCRTCCKKIKLQNSC